MNILDIEVVLALKRKLCSKLSLDLRRGLKRHHPGALILCLHTGNGRELVTQAVQDYLITKGTILKLCTPHVQ